MCYDKIAENKKDATKIACKGVSKLTNEFQYEQYLQVVYEHKSFDAVNYNFRVKENRMCTLKCTKTGLAGVQTKNYVNADRVSIQPHAKHL